MSLVPEYIIQKVLVRGFRAFREEPELLAMLFRNLRQEELAGLQKYFREQSIDIHINWPDAVIKVPAVSISLKNENESQAFIGELVQSTSQIRDIGIPFSVDEESALAPTGAGSVDTVGDTQASLAGPFQAVDGDISKIILGSNVTNLTDPFEAESLKVHIIEGTGAGQERSVFTITPRIQGSNLVEVVVTPDWDTAPDNTSIVEFQGINLLSSDQPVTGQPSKLYNQGSFLERLGQQYKVNYQLLIIGPDQDITIFLYTVIKAIFILNREYLHQHGFINLSMGGTDFTPRPEFLPDLTYQRALLLAFDYTFDVYLEPETISKIRVSLEVFDPDVDDASGVSRVVSDTTVE